MNANKVFYLTVIFFVISIAGLAALFLKSVYLAFAQTIYICQRILSGSSLTLPHLLPTIAAFFAAFVLSLGLFNLIFQIIKTRLYINGYLIKTISLPRKVSIVVRELSLERRIKLVKSTKKFSFCYGFIFPKIVLSESLIKDLAQGELKAVLLHESYHLKNRDPLKIIIGQAVSNMFFFVPILSDIQKYYAFSKEIAADRLTIERSSRKNLLSALTKVISSPRLGGIAAFATTNDLERRILYLTGNDKVKGLRISPLNLLISAAVFLISFSILTIPVHAMNTQMQTPSYFVCPFGDQCAKECKGNLKSSGVNFSQAKNYSSTNDK